MKRLTCEMCGSTDMMKQDGVFVCQSCGCKYSVEEARKMMVEGTVEVTGTVRIDNSSQFGNLMQLARDAIIDTRFDNAYTYSSEALTINPNDLELIAIQGLAVFGKDEQRNGVPASSTNAMKRLFSGLEESTEPASKKLEILKTVKKYIETICKIKADECNSIIRNLNSQKVGYSEGDERWANTNVALNALAGNVFTRFSAQAERDKVLAQKQHDTMIEQQISTVRSRLHSVNGFSGTYKRQIDTAITKYTKVAEEERDAYWNAHADVKAMHDAEVLRLNGELEQTIASLKAARVELSNFNREIYNHETDVDKKEKALRAEMDALEKQRDALGLFKGKEKKELNAKIDALRAQLPSFEDKRIAREAYKDSLRETSGKFEAEVKELEDRQKALNDSISAITFELTKYR